ncbi:MAG: hypothetical protein SOX53_03775 [Candidatus Onthovivens sp.]|nr:hypothetical protein [Candidatus Onthovivens sp.]
MNITGKTTLCLNRNQYGESMSVCYKIQRKDVVTENGKDVAKYVNDWAYLKVKFTQDIIKKLAELKEIQEFAKKMKQSVKLKIDIKNAFLSGYKNDNGIVYPYIMIQELEIIKDDEKKEETVNTTHIKASLFDTK